MDEIKVSQLDAVDEIKDTDQIMIVQSGANKKISGSYINEHGVTVSSTAPDTSQRVWFEQSKNLFNKNSALRKTGINSSGNLVQNNNYFTSELIKVNSNTDYYVVGAAVVYGYSNSGSYIGMLKETLSAGTFNTGEAIYIRLRNWWATDDTQMEEQINATMLNIGTTGLPYEEYIAPSIIVDNREIYQKQEITTSSAIVDTTYISNTEQNLITRVGQLVEFDFIFTTTGTWTSTTKMFTGLPKPNTTTKIRFVALKTNPEVPLRFQLNADGSIQNGWSNATISSGQIIEGHITYITID